MKVGVYGVKKVVFSTEFDVLMKNNVYINRFTKIKELVKEHYPDLYKKHVLKNILRPDLSVRRIVNWPLLIFELDDNGHLDNDDIFKQT